MAPCFKTWFRGLLRIHPDAAKPQRRLFLFPPLVGEAWESIGNHPLRTFLAMLGIVIGVASVVVMLGIGTASQHRVERTINSLGTNLLIITAGGSRITLRDRHDFDLNDVDAIAQLPLAETVGYSTAVSTRSAYSNNMTTQTRVIGTIPEYLSIRNWEFKEGAVFSADDLRQGKRAVVIGNSLADQLFPGESALGRFIAFGEDRLRFEVVGILEAKGPGLSGEDQDNIAFVPISTFKTFFATPFDPLVQMIYVKAFAPENLGELADSVRDVLRQRHDVPEARPDYFTIQNVNAVVQVASEASRAFAVLLGAIASVSLLVGGIGIMNIMLVTVSERTREIGIRKAIGGTEQQILVQFLLEAIIISGAGSVIGLFLGIAGGIVADHLLSIPVEFTVWPVVLALGMSLGIGLPSGIYPAYKASRLQPIEALRAVGG